MTFSCERYNEARAQATFAPGSRRARKAQWARSNGKPHNFCKSAWNKESERANSPQKRTPRLWQSTSPRLLQAYPSKPLMEQPPGTCIKSSKWRWRHGRLKGERLRLRNIRAKYSGKSSHGIAFIAFILILPRLSRRQLKRDAHDLQQRHAVTAF